MGVPGLNTYVGTLIVYDSNLIAGGQFPAAGGTLANNVAQWNGAVWQPLGSGMNGSVWALTVYHGNLIAGGDFTTAGGASANYVAQWNGTAWQPLGDGMNGAVSSLTVYNGKLIAGGNFTTAGGVSAKRIAQWNDVSARWQPLGSGVSGANAPTSVYALTVYNGHLSAGGNFTTTGRQVSPYWARWCDCNLCEADVSPPDGGDRVVNIDDLLAVITNWGALGPNPGDANHNGITNIDDLLAVINSWGRCP